MPRNTITVSVLANTDKLKSAFDGAEGTFKKFAAAGAAVAAVVGVAAVAIGTKAVASASALEQSMGALQSVFKENSQQMTDWANSAASNLGLAKSEYAQLGTVLGSQLRNMGVDSGALAGQTNDLIKMGADLAAQFGGSTSDAVGALSSLLRGERDPIERYGVSINEAALQAKMAEMGLTGLSGEAEKNAKLQATLALLTQQTADATGAFARESNTLAGAQQRLAAGTENLYARIGQALLPAVTAVTGAFGGLLNKMAESEGFGNFLNGVTAFSVALGTLINDLMNGQGGFGQFFQSILGGAGPLLQLASYFSPIGIALNILKPLLPPLASAFTELGSSLGGALSAILPVLAGLFQQLAVALVPIIAPVIQLATTLASALVPVFDALAPVLTMIAGLLVSLVTALTPVMNAVTALITPILSLIAPLMQLLQAVLPPVIAVITMLANTIAAVLTPIINALIPIIEAVVQVLQGVIDFVVGVFTGNWEQAWNGIKGIFEGIWNLIVGIIQGVWTIITTLIQNAVNQVLAVVQAWGPSLLSFITQAWNNVMSFFNSIPGWVQGAFAAAGQWLLQSGVSIVTGLYNGIKNFWNNVTSFFGSIPGLIGAAFAGAGSWLVGVGRNIIDGLINGLRNAAGAVTNMLMNIAKGAVNAFKNFFGIKSPSRLFESFGVFIDRGLANGLKKGVHHVRKGMGAVNAVVTKSFNPTLDAGEVSNTLSASSAAAGGGVTYNISVDGGLSTSHEIGRAIVENIKSYQLAGRQAVSLP